MSDDGLTGTGSTKRPRDDGGTGSGESGGRTSLSRKVKRQRVAIQPVLPCEVEKMIADRADEALLKQHLEAIDVHRQKYEKRLAEEPDVVAHKAKITEAKGEFEATVLMLKAHGDHRILWTFGPGTGFDQLWFVQSPDDTYVIVEAKGPGAKLSEGAKKGDQMSTEWVRNTLEELSHSKSLSDTDRGHVEKMLKGIDVGPPPKVTGKVITAEPGGGAIEMTDCPDGGIYHRQK
jgi:hypothetical protein